MQRSTLCLPVRDHPTPQVLLGLKKTGFGKGKITGFGGKAEPDETIPQAAARELEEETGIRVSEIDLVPAGCLTFFFPAAPTWSQMVHVFIVRRWQGMPAESNEMIPKWYPQKNLPLNQMWSDGPHWLPSILAGNYVRARFTFHPDNETIEYQDIQIEPRKAMNTREEMTFKAQYAHTNIIASDWVLLARFYEEVFGCTPVLPERDLSGPWLDALTGLSQAHLRGVHLRLPGHGENGPTLEIFAYDQMEERTEPAANRPGIAHLAFAVDDVTAARDAVLAAGGGTLGEVVTVEIPGTGPLCLMYVTDPEGNIIELQHWL